jgi:hypothetical protein
VTSCRKWQAGAVPMLWLADDSSESRAWGDGVVPGLLVKIASEQKGLALSLMGVSERRILVFRTQYKPKSKRGRQALRMLGPEVGHRPSPRPPH